MEKYEKLVDRLNKKNTIEILEIIKKYNRITRIDLFNYINNLDNISLANKIKEANTIIDNTKACEFKNCVIKGIYLDFLNKLDVTDKMFLKVDLNLNKEILSKEEMNYLDIINKSIEEDMENLRESMGLVREK